MAQHDYPEPEEGPGLIYPVVWYLLALVVLALTSAVGRWLA